MLNLRSRMQRMGDSLWLWLNKKPNTKKEVIIALIVPWVGVGMVLWLALALSTISGWLVILPLVFAGWVAYLEWGQLKPYSDGIYEKYLKDRDEQIARIYDRLLDERAKDTVRNK